MSSVPELSVTELWAGLKSLAFRLITDPNLVPKVKALWDAIMALFDSPPQANPAAAETAEAWFVDVPPEKLFDGQIIGLISKISQFIDSHPQLVSFLLSLLALIPKEAAPTA